MPAVLSALSPVPSSAHILQAYLSLPESLQQVPCLQTSHYLTYIQDSLRKLTEDLARHDSSKPSEVSKPAEKIEDKVYQEQLTSANERIEQLRLLIEEKRRELTETNIKIDETNQLISRIQLLENDVVEVNQMFQAFIIKNGMIKYN